MKIALISRYYPLPWNGVGIHIYYLSRELSKLGHEVHVVTTKQVHSPNEKMDNTVYRQGGISLNIHAFINKAIKMLPKFRPRLYNDLAAWARRNRPEAILNAKVNLKRSLVFAMYHANETGSLYIKHCLEDNQIYDCKVLKEKLSKKLFSFCSGMGMKVDILSPYDIYTGQYVGLAPDILFEIDDLACTVNPTSSREVYKSRPAVPSSSGTHRKNGIFLAYEPDIKNGARIQSATIYDMAPTILHIFNHPIPKDIDGKALIEIFQDSSDLRMRSVKYQETAEEMRMRRRLKELKSAGRI